MYRLYIERAIHKMYVEGARVMMTSVHTVCHLTFKCDLDLELTTRQIILFISHCHADVEATFEKYVYY